MAKNVNKIILVGRCGTAPEAKQLRNGMTKVEFSLATNRMRKGEEITDWFSCQCWDKVGELAQRLVAKGDLLYVEGRMESSRWEDKDGNKRTRWEVTVHTLVPMSRKDSGADGGGSYSGGSGGGSYGGGGGSYGGGSGNSQQYTGQSSGSGGGTGAGSSGGDDWLDGGDGVPF